MEYKSHLWVQEPRLIDGQVRVESVLELPNFEAKKLWFSIPEEQSSALSKNCDPFVLGILFLAMRSGHALFVHGEVSPSLLMNLEDFQSAWQILLPHRYKMIDIGVENEHEHPETSGSLALSAFSGGIDSCFTVWRHSFLNECISRRKLQSAIMVHGFDIPLEEKSQFKTALENSRKILASTEVELIPVVTNYKELNNYWGDSHGAGLAFCLMMFQGRYSNGLIASSVSYDDIFLPWGSTPVTDGLMSNRHFSIVHDGSGFTRNEKARQLTAWPEAMKYLRVCWEGEQRDQNCCTCEKCVRTILNFRAVGAGLPECFKQDVTLSQLMHMRNLGHDELYDLKKIYLDGRKTVGPEPWMKVLRKTIWVNKAINLRSRLWERLSGIVRRRWRKLVDYRPSFIQRSMRHRGKRHENSG